MYDTHCHLNFQAFSKNYRDVIKRSLNKGMFLNIVGSQYETSKRAIVIAHEFENDGVYATVGLHPTHLEKADEVYEWDYEKYKKLGEDPKVVAIGETGIDLFRLKDTIKEQKRIFLEHTRLSQELGKPLIIHCRPSNGTFDAYDELFDILKSYKLIGVLHCFLADWLHAQKFLDLGFYISFTGIITFKNADSHLIDATKNIPLSRTMLETDAPYLTPEPYRGKAQNEPLYTEFIARKIAELKKISYEEVIQITTNNAKKLFLNL